MNILNLFFGFQGRIGRGLFWLINVALSILALCATAWCGSVAMKNGATSVDAFQAQMSKMVPGIIVIVICLWSCSAAHVKRLHDRDKSGWFMMFYFVPALLTGTIPGMAWVAGLVQLWFFVELGFFSGTAGPNQFDGDRPSALLSASEARSGKSWADDAKSRASAKPQPASRGSGPSAPTPVSFAPRNGPASFGRRGV